MHSLDIAFADSAHVGTWIWMWMDVHVDDGSDQTFAYMRIVPNSNVLSQMLSRVTQAYIPFCLKHDLFVYMLSVDQAFRESLPLLYR